ncbi:MAG: cyclic nucleotide-binding domain-containing protein [Symploca sp. SIO3C6]|nr:cyclic nucleotide-binding domain-containing protein [Symploca sp. SIO3C6]
MLEVLPKISLFKDLTTQEQLKILQVGTEISLSPGDMLFKQEEPATHFYMVITGAIQISRRIDNRELVLATYESGKFFGEVPLLAGVAHLASGKAVSSSQLLTLKEEDFWQVLMLFPSVRKAVLGNMASRMQELQTLSQHRQKLVALGTLAAGLAHELNNPASAARGAARQLHDTMPKRHALALKCLEQRLEPVKLEYLLELKRNAIENTTASNSLDLLTKMDLEDQLTSWLEEHGITDGWKLAPNLVAGGLNTEHLEVISERLTTDTLRDVLIWLEAMLTEASLVNVLDQGINRISELVGAVKSYSYVDQAYLKKKNTDVHQGIDNTLTILGYKLRRHRISVIREYAENLPCIQADGGALNQVWTNLIDNAIDALEEQGTIWIRTLVEKDYLTVEIADNGPGIPPEIQSRIFDPFFTTKEVGKGTGIGLDLSYRIIVSEHHGNIRCFSAPGNTRFLIYLPIGSVQSN